MKRVLGIIGAAGLLLSSAAFGADRYVDDDDVTCGGNSPCYSSIGAALAAVAADGETISVAAGAYSENLDINRPVNLIGAGAGVTFIESANGASEFLIRLGANVPITFSEGMVLDGFTLRGPLSGDHDLVMFRARVLDANDPIILRNNVFDCENDHALKGIESRSGGDISNVVIEDNDFINECGYSMFLNSAINWLIQRNDFEPTWTGGLLINTSTVGQLHDIQILDNIFDGVTQRPDAGGFLPNQYLAAIGLSSPVYNVQVSGNVIMNGGGHSVTIGDRTNVDLSGVDVSCNDMENNFAGALNELPANVIPAEDNWWGDATGPFNAGSNPGGAGDPVTDGWDFDPFLTAPFGPNCGSDVIDCGSEVTFVVLPGTASFSPVPVPGGPAGTYTFMARMTNVGAGDMSSIATETTVLTNGNTLVNADGGPGGVGSILTVPLTDDYSDGTLSPGEMVDVEYVIGLAIRARFEFRVDVLCGFSP